MSKRNTRPTARGRAAPLPVRKSFPWGTAIGAGVLGLFLVSILGYAVVNAGADAVNPLREADKAVQGVSVADEAPSQGHKAGPLEYSTTPTSGGEHNNQWSTCQGNVYDAELAEENVAHSMEHGAVYVSYRPDLPKDQVATLRDLVEGTDYRLMSPFPDQEAPISIQAWGRQLTVDSADDSRLEEFAKQYTNGPQAPEKGATCSSGTQISGVSDPVEAEPPGAPGLPGAPGDPQIPETTPEQ